MANNANASCPDSLDFDVKLLGEDKKVNLCNEYLGKVILVVNTASKCGFTPQYEGLEKLYKEKKDRAKEEKNLETALLIDPANEEAILMLMEISIEKTNYSKVKELSDRFTKVCKKLCKKNDEILKDLENLEPKNES